MVGSSRKTQVRVADERQREVEPPPLAAGELARQRVALGVELDQIDQLLDAATRLVVAAVHLDQLSDGQVGLDAAGLQHDPEAFAQPSRPSGRIEAEDADATGVARAVALEDLGDRRLAGAVGAEQAEDLPLRDGEAHSADGLKERYDLCRSVTSMALMCVSGSLRYLRRAEIHCSKRP